MSLRVLVVAISCTALTPVVRAQDPGSRFDFSCIDFLELPTRGLLAAGAGTSGTVRAVAKIGKKGQLSKLTLTGGNRGLQGEVRVAMNLSRFAGKCQGRSVEFVFAFTLEDPPTDSIIPPGVRFVPPNRFELIFRRVKPIVDFAPSKN
jgi:hypothetical protein